MTWLFSPFEKRIRRAVQMRRWKAGHPKRVQEIMRKHYRLHIEYYRAKDRVRGKTEIRKTFCRKQYRRHRDKRIARNRRKRDPIYAFICATRTRIRRVLKNAATNKSATTVCLLGCTPRQFKQHLESLFLPGMAWANRSLWHIDHKKPVSSFDLTTEAGQRAAFHYTNCQPLWALDNLRKGAKVCAQEIFQSPA
jgi:hypothetical protein